LGPAEAKREMAKNLTIKERADTSVFPKPQYFYKYYTKYLTEINGDLGGVLMNQAIEKLQKDFPECVFAFQPKTNEKQMSLCIGTPLMKRILGFVPQSSELLFMDTTGHVDTMNNNITLILTWSPAGGLPVGVLITESQQEEAYYNGNYLICIVMIIILICV